MPSSFVDSVPPIVKLLIELNPKKVIDIGPGWGKYGLMCREYLPDLETLDAVEVKEGRLYTQETIYDNVIEGDVRLVNCNWGDYDVVLFIDVIEHMTKEEGQNLLLKIVNSGAIPIVSTPKIWMEQHDENNPYEEHVSHWTWKDLWIPGMVECAKKDVSTIDSMIMALEPIS